MSSVKTACNDFRVGCRLVDGMDFKLEDLQFSFLCLNISEVAEKTDLARIITKAKVFKLVTDKNACVGCVYEKGGQNFQEFGPVILASGRGARLV